MKLSIIIPLFNEENTILKLLNVIEKQTKIEKQIIIINDCSNDKSLELLSNYTFLSENLILNHQTNKGKGACIKTAKKYITGDIIVIQDADLEYDPNDYYNLIKPILDKKTNVVYGSRVRGKQRYKSNKFTSLTRIFFNHFLTIISNLINNQNLTDAHTCYKLIRKSVFDQINLIENDFSFCPEVTTKLSRMNEKIIEVPISYIGRTYKEGKKIKYIDGIKAIFTLFNYRFIKKI